ncbi:MAG: hypothetical protein IKB38_02955 [Clostridia bacterium]|nr:hypothetical protein [Clostridia bacterium]
MRKILLLFLLISTSLFVFTSCANEEDAANEDQNYTEKDQIYAGKEKNYQEALKLIDIGDYNRAYEIFKSLGDYEDSNERLNKFHYIPAFFTQTVYFDESIIVYERGEFLFNESNLPSAIIPVGVELEISKTLTYDENNRIIKAVLVGYDETETTCYTYDESGNVTKMIFTRSTENTEPTKKEYDYFYNEKGELIKEICSSLSGISSVIYTYDDSNLIKKVSTAEGGYTTSSVYTYDNNNNLIRQTLSDQDGELNSTVYVYDSKNNLIKKEYTAASGYTSSTVYTYDDRNNIVKETSTSQNSDGLHTTVYTYDENGNLIKRTYTTPSGEETCYEINYKFVYIPHDLSDEEIDSFFEELFNY